MKIGPCRLTKAEYDRAVAEYTALHEGLPPRELVCERLPPPSPAARVLGRATEIQYRKATPAKEGRAAAAWDPPVRRTYSYHHPYASQARPRLVVDAAGQLGMDAGRYEVTRRGIEDRVAPGTRTEPELRRPHVRPERAPRAPRALTTLGTLEWIAYKGKTPGRAARLVFPPAIAPDLARDPDGDLHVLGGRYVITERGVERMYYDNPRRRSRSGRRRRANPHRRSHHRYDNPLDARGHMHSARTGRFARSRRHRYANPSARASRGGSTAGERAGRMILASVVVGAVAVVTAVGLDMALAGLAWTAPVKALVKIGAGLAVGVGIGAAAKMPSDPSRLGVAPALASGVAIGGVYSGLRDLWALYVAPMLAPAPVAPPLPPPNPNPTGYAWPAAQAQLPGGVPASYVPYTPATCGVYR